MKKTKQMLLLSLSKEPSISSNSCRASLYSNYWFHPTPSDTSVHQSPITKTIKLLPFLGSFFSLDFIIHILLHFPSRIHTYWKEDEPCEWNSKSGRKSRRTEEIWKQEYITKKTFTKSRMKLKSGLGLCMKNLLEGKKRKRQQDGEPQRSPTRRVRCCFRRHGQVIILYYLVFTLSLLHFLSLWYLIISKIT